MIAAASVNIATVFQALGPYIRARVEAGCASGERNGSTSARRAGTQGVVPLTDRGFDVADASVQLGELESNATVIVDYWAGWCGLPTRLTPAFERLQAFGGRLRFAKLKVDANPQAPSTRGVRGIPTTPVLCGGQADARPVDLESADRMRLQLERRLKAA